MKKQLDGFIEVPKEFNTYIKPKLEIGGVINKTLSEKDISVRSFAESIDMKHPQVFKVLKGDKNYTIDTLLTILDALDLKISIEKK